MMINYIFKKTIFLFFIFFIISFIFFGFPFKVFAQLQLTLFFEQKFNGFLRSEPIPFIFENNLAYIVIEGNFIKAFKINNDKHFWEYKLSNNTFQKIIFNQNTNIILIEYNNLLEFIDIVNGKLINQLQLNDFKYILSPNGFIVFTLNELKEISKESVLAYPLKLNNIKNLKLNYLITKSGKYYLSILDKDNVKIYEYAGNNINSLKERFSFKIDLNTEFLNEFKTLLCYHLNNDIESLKYIISYDKNIKVYNLNSNITNYEIKTKSQILELYGFLNETSNLITIITKHTNSYSIYNESEKKLLFDIEVFNKNDFLPIIIFMNNINLIGIFKNNNHFTIYDINNKIELNYLFENKPISKHFYAVYLSNTNEFLFLFSNPNSILSLKLLGMNLSSNENIVFSSNYQFLPQYKIKKNILNFNIDYQLLSKDQLNKIIILYNEYKNIIHVVFLLLCLLLVLKFIKKRLKRSNPNISTQLIDVQIQRIKKLITEQPDNIELITNLINLLKQTKQVDELIEYYKMLIKLKPEDEKNYEELLEFNCYFPYINELVSLYKKKFMVKNTISLFEQKIATFKSNNLTSNLNYIAMLKILSRLYIEQKNITKDNEVVKNSLSKAIELLEEIIKIEPDSIYDLTLLAKLYTENQNHNSAINIYKKLISIDKSNDLLNHLKELMIIYDKIANFTELVATFNKILELDKIFAEQLSDIIIQNFNESIKNENKTNVLLFGNCLINYYETKKNIAKAIEIIEKLLKLYPNEKLLLKRKAFLMLENEIYDGILELFNQLIELFNEDLQIKFEYAKLLLKFKNYDKCLQMIVDSIRKKEMEEEYLNLFEKVCIELINDKKSQKIIELAPLIFKLTQSTISLKCLADAYLKLGEIDRAYDILVKASQIKQNDEKISKRLRYVKTLVDEKKLLEMKSNDNEFELLIDGEPIKVKRTEIDIESKIQTNPIEIKIAEAKLLYEKENYKNAITIFQELLNEKLEIKQFLIVNIYLINSFLKEGLVYAAENIYENSKIRLNDATNQEILAYKYKVGEIFLEHNCLNQAEKIFLEVASIDINYKNVNNIILKIKKQIEEQNKYKQTIDSNLDSEKTVIVNVKSEIDYIDKRFKIINQIGKGGMGIVYKVIDTTNNNVLAIKIPIITFKDDKFFIERFEREAKLTMKLKHPNILNVIEVFEGELPYMVMEFIEGQSLRDILKANKSLNYLKMRDIIVQCCDALAYTHKMNIIHRDIKPENIMITNQNVVKLMDFGLAKALDETTITKAGTVLGTFSYSSPEQCLGDKVDARSDIYSLGVMMYEMLTSEKPFTGGDLVHQHLNVKPMALTKKNPLISYQVEAIVLKCLEKKPEDRYQTTLELKEALLKTT